MAKKRDILSNYFTDFPTFKKSYQARLVELKRDFNNEKNVYEELLKQINIEYEDDQNLHLNKYLNEELMHEKRKNLVDEDYHERFDLLSEEITGIKNNQSSLIDEENKLYQDILNQFEERKQEALDRYLQLIHESEREIDESVGVHYTFIEDENKKTSNLKEYYQDINNFLANDLLNTMEKAKNALDSLNDSLKATNISDSKELNQTVLKSLEHLRGTQIGIISLFKDNSNDLELQRESIKRISKNKQQPHSELNQEMIKKYVVQIRELNNERIAFELKVKNDLDMSLNRVYNLILKANEEHDYSSLEKYILQKEIIEKKAEYLLHRNTTLTNFTISKYQQEIKKIKIDSFKRSEEIKLAYSVPITFLQNSIDTYSNFAFYLNQGFDELDRLLNSLIDFHQEFLDVKTNFVTTTSKAYEDYKINLIVRINEVTGNLTKLVSKIDDVSLQIVTLESRNRLEVAGIRKKIDSLEILGDYQKYLASLENDEFFAMYQHNKNIESIQVKSRYKESLLKINNEVLELNKNKELAGEHLQYMLNLSKEEEAIHKLGFDKMISQQEAFYKQQNQLSYLMYKIAKLELIDQIKTTNYQYVKKYFEISSKELEKDQVSSNSVIEFVHYMQKLINANNKTTSAFKRYLANSNNNMSYLTIVEKNRATLHEQIDHQLEKKISACYQAASLYHRENNDIINHTLALVNGYVNKYKQLLIYNEDNNITYQAEIIKSRGYFDEVSTLITYIYNKVLYQAYKYQVPEVIEKLTLNYNDTLEKYNHLVLEVFDKFKLKTKTRTFYNKIQVFLINSLKVLQAFQDQITSTLTIIRDKISENDISFIANAKIQVIENKKIIDKEYDGLAFQAIKLKTKRNKQIDALLNNSNQINESFKSRVKKINDEYLKEKNKTTEFLAYLEKEVTNIINDNDKQLLKMLKLIDKEIFNERVKFTNQHKKYLNSLSAIRSSMTDAYNSEVKYLYDLNFKREEDISKTIVLLEQKINVLPEEKTNIMQTMDLQKQELFLEKQNELLQKFAEIEGTKLLSKPDLLEQIQAVEKRLPEDYIKLYKEVQDLENDFLQQYTLISESHYDTYQDYINKQFANRLLIENDSKITKSFEWLNTYHKDLLTIFQLNYKELMQKSIESRDIINEEKRKSKEKQDRIINA